MPFDTSIQKVALAGASGPIGQAIVAELLKSKLFDITILTRDSTTYQSPFAPALKVLQVDYSSLSSLTHALTNQDALISALAPSAIPTQKLLIDACIQAHVHRFLPSEYSYDFCSPTMQQQLPNNPVFGHKIAIESYLKEQATHTSLSYTLLFSNPILEPSLQNNLFFHFQNRTAILNPRSKTAPISLTTLPSLSKAVRRILTHPRETANRPIRIKDIDISHEKLVSIAQSLTPGQEWDIRTDVSSDSDSDSNFNFGGSFERVHNSVFGIKGMTQEELEEVVRVTCGVEKS